MRLIDKDMLIEILGVMQGLCDTKAALIQNSKIWQQVKDLPTVDAEPVRHGKWIDRNGAIVAPFWERYECSECGARSDNSNYCPNCGARMDKDETD